MVAGASMVALMRIAVAATILIAARSSWAAPPATVPCCLPDGSCRELSPAECEGVVGGDVPAASTCSDPNPCISCCRSGDPVSCEDNIRLRDCVVAKQGQFVSRAECGSEGQCITIKGGDCTDPAQCATGFCVDGVCCNTACRDPNATCNLPDQRGTCSTVAPAPAMTAPALAMLAVLLLGLATYALRSRA